jgi:hypothetical protein
MVALVHDVPPTLEETLVVHNLFHNDDDWNRLSKDDREEYLETLAKAVPLGKRADGRPILPIRGGADGIYYRDLRTPFVIADQSGITLAATQKALWAPALSIFPANYWGVLGKTVTLTAFTKITAGTAGNWTFAMAYGSGDAPAPIVTSATRAKVASVGPFQAYWKGYATLRSTGTTGTLSMTGLCIPDLAAMLSTNQPNIFPQNGTTVVSTIDTTVGTNALTFQMSNSAGTDTVVTTNLYVEAMN